MKTIFIGLLLSLMLSNAKAQNSTSEFENALTGFCSINFGTAFALGNFASTSGTNTKAGFAESGWNLHLADGLAYHSNFGMSIKVDYGSNPFNMTSYISQQQAQTSQIVTAGTGGSYSYVNLMIGVYATIPIHKFSIDFRFLGGIMFVTTPAVSFSSSYTDLIGDMNVYNYNIASGSPTTVSVDGGIGFRWNVSRKICTMLYCDYLMANPSYSQKGEITFVQNGTTQSDDTRSSSITQPISLLSITGGIGISIGKK